MCEYFHVWIFFTGEYFSGVNISQFKFRIRTDYFGLVLKDIYGRRNEKFEEYLSTNESLFCIFKFLNLLIFSFFFVFQTWEQAHNICPKESRHLRQ